MKQLLRIAIVLSGLPGWVAPQLANAEVLCQAEISFQWKKAEAENEIKEVWGRLQARGADEKEAKANLQKLTDPERNYAVDRCRRNHENQSTCVATRFAAYSGTLQALGFSARKKLEESIVADCKLAAGTCLGATVADPTCSEIVAAAAADEKGAKDAKAKKK